VCLLFGSIGVADAAQQVFPEYLPPDPSSDFVMDQIVSGGSVRSMMPIDFCAEWNPEFPYNGYRCCTNKLKYSRSKHRRRPERCTWQRRKTSYCSEMTDEQREYTEKVSSGQWSDVLTLLSRQASVRSQDQSFCDVNNGFLVNGRRILSTPHNRLEIRNPQRCLDFGTDPMVGMLEWVGRTVDANYSEPEYAGVRLLVGDVSAPRGGCLPGRVGRKGHASHTTGQDVDLGFLAAKAKARSPASFQKQFDPVANWWLIKQIFKNPYACVKVAFLDRTLINKLVKAARGDPDWTRLRPFIRHVRGHRNHWHIRIGAGPGQPGCPAAQSLDFDEDEDMNDMENVPGDAMPDGEGPEQPRMIHAEAASQ